MRRTIDESWFGKRRRHSQVRRLQVQQLEDRSLLTAGGLDPSFNGTGYAITSVSSNAYDFAYDVVVQPGATAQAEGKIITVGTSSNSKTLKVASYAVRHLANGQRDPSFGSNGVANVTIGNSSYLRNAALQGDKVLLAGAAEGANWAGKENFAIVRLNANGTLDKTFGKNGVVQTDMGATRERIEAIAVYPDGRFVVAGWTNVNGDRFALGGPDIQAGDSDGHSGE